MAKRLINLRCIDIVKLIERNQAAYHYERKYIFWCNAHEQGNYVSIHSEKFKSNDKKCQYY